MYCLVFAVGLIVVLIRTGSITGLGGSWKALIDLIAAVLLSLGLAYVWRSATITKRDYLAVQGLFRVKRIPWADIQDIRVERNPAGSAHPERPGNW